MWKTRAPLSALGDSLLRLGDFAGAFKTHTQALELLKAMKRLAGVPPKWRGSHVGLFEKKKKDLRLPRLAGFTYLARARCHTQLGACETALLDVASAETALTELAGCDSIPVAECSLQRARTNLALAGAAGLAERQTDVDRLVSRHTHTPA